MIKEFYKNKEMREAVKNYIEAVYSDVAVEMVFARKDVAHIADAMELLQEAFAQMDRDFAPIKKKGDIINQAR